MKNYILFLSMLLLIYSCKKDSNNVDDNFLTWDFTTNSQWTNSGGENPNTFRNIHYTFDVTENDDITIGISTEEQSYLYILNEAKTVLAENNDSLISVNLSAGKHKLVVATRVEGKSGPFELFFKGEIENVNQVIVSNATISDNWINSSAQNYNSFRNQHYNISITADTYLDIILNTNLSSQFYLLQNGNVIAETDNDVISIPVNAGDYNLVFTTFSDNQSGDFEFYIVGEYQSIDKIEASVLFKNSNWQSSGGRNFESPNNPNFTIEVEEDGFVDVLLNTNADAYLYLLNNNQLLYETDDNDFSQFLEAGEYTIVVATFLEGVTANFEITTYGKINNLIEE